ncbi:MAG: hypothetical protein HOV80_04325 [Polyangiaceae bacterium]|nr:hypothetical protein [Polyangiaceae bacterium]
MEEEPVPPEEEFADALPLEQTKAIQGNEKRALPPAPPLELEPQSWGPIYYPMPEEPAEGEEGAEGEGGAPPVQIENVEVVDPPPDQPYQLPSFD